MSRNLSTLSAQIVRTMKHFLSIAALLFLLIIAGCGYKASDNNSGTPAQTIEVPSNLPAFTPDSSIPNTSQPTMGSQATMGTGTTAQATPNSTGAALNPAHGQPGHRCDIAVGVPLDSKPGTGMGTTPATTTATSPAPITSTPQTVQPITAASTGKATAGLNPAHGQPGHRCDIAVGAPLNSKPGAATTTTSAPANSSPVVGSSPFNGATNTTPAQKSTISPIPVTPVMPAGNTQAAPSSGAGLNPAHGQPGHRCDIAVGAPLNSKPVAPASPTKQ